MLTLHPPSSAPEDAHWIDLCDPTPEETAAVERALGVSLPNREALSSLDAPRPSVSDQAVLRMTAPLLLRERLLWRPAPTGFILDEKRLVSVRYSPLPAFDAVHQSMLEHPAESGLEVFTRILEEVVDRISDRLVECAQSLDGSSQAVFEGSGGTKPSLFKRTAELRTVMSETGRTSELMSQARYVMLCLGRLSQYVSDRCGDWPDAKKHEARLASVRLDIQFMSEFEENLLGRVQLLQDAANAFISIEQNEVVKILTITSVVGIPPVLVVGVYGMNFKNMPELSWTYGYEYGLALVVISALLPLIWFKKKGWL